VVRELSEQAKRTESELSPKHRARFLRLLGSKKGTAVAAVLDGTCSVCHFSVRPHLQQRVRRCEEIIVCEHCQRILYLSDIFNSVASRPTSG
jgi:predicted  nucleic acid-binding Zn-ribbon protein